MTGQPNGIVLVTGPTGSGKTTTLYSTLKTLATPEVNVCTIEDPIEMIEPSFNQMQVQQSIDLDRRGRARADAPGPGHHHGGRDPRSSTAEMAIQAALTGAPRSVHAAHQPTPPARSRGCSSSGCRPTCSTRPSSASWAQRLVRTSASTARKKSPTKRGARRLELEEFVAPWKAKPSGAHLPPVGASNAATPGYNGPHRPVTRSCSFPRR